MTVTVKKTGDRAKTTTSNALKGKFDVVTQAKLTTDAENDIKKG